MTDWTDAKKLLEGIASCEPWDTPIDPKLKAIIDSGNKTYRYIAITALLAKTINPSLNALSLQKGSALPGAYDARSLCHKVIVPSEFNAWIGSSNEPFLNKPARYLEVSLDNATRDKSALKKLYDFLVKLNLQPDDAPLHLVGAIAFCRSEYLAQNEVGEYLSSVTIEDDSIRQLLGLKCNGEAAVLIVGSLLTATRAADEEIVVHPVNQSGASSNEVGDIDCKRNGSIVTSIEVKDKSYSLADVKHAVSKASRAKVSHFYFIEGPQAKIVDGAKDDALVYAREIGVNLRIVELEAFYNVMSLSVNFNSLPKIISDTMRTARMSNDTVSQVLTVLTQ